MKRIIGAADGLASPKVQTWVVDEAREGQRLDNYLLAQLPGVPKTHIYRIIRSGEVRVNKARAAVDTRVQWGDIVRVPPLRPPAPAPAGTESPPAPAREFPLLWEDEHLLALDKPAGVAVHGGSGVSFGVIEQLRRARPQAKLLELVHRLDRETSGILLVAKRRSALKRLQDQFRERATGKTYLALVQGVWPERLKVIDLPLRKFQLPGSLGQEGERRVRVAQPDDPEGQRAITLVQVAQRLQGCTLLQVTIKTGRTHQIRVHLAHHGHPIAGDDKYGHFEWNKDLQKQGLRRMFLHAWRLQFSHPASAEPLALQAPLPPDLEQHLRHVQPPSPSL